VILWLATVTSGIADLSQLWSPFGDHTKISIDPPERGKVPLCAAFRGTAPVKKGKVLWLMHGNTGHYVIKKAQHESDGRWIVSGTNVGGPDNTGDTYHLYVFYVDEPLSQFMDGLWARRPDGRPGGVFVSALPPNAQDVVHETIVRDGPPYDTPCP
jgi:hypothetical protein